MKSFWWNSCFGEHAKEPLQDLLELKNKSWEFVFNWKLLQIIQTEVFFYKYVFKKFLLKLINKSREKYHGIFRQKFLWKNCQKFFNKSFRAITAFNTLGITGDLF